MTDNITRRPRTRPRQVVDAQPVASDNPKVTQKMKDLAKSAFEARSIKNAATNKEKKALDQLTGLMSEAGLKEFALGAEIVGIDGSPKKVQIDVEMAGSTTTTIDVAALRKLVDDKTFMKIVKATVGDAEKHLGPSLLAQVKRTKTGEPTAKLKAAK